MYLPNGTRTTLVVALLFGMVAPAASAAERPARKPSLDALIARVSAYWELTANGKKTQALEYVQPQSRDTYLALQTPGFSDPRITNLELQPDPSEVMVTVKVRCVLPQTPAPFDWPVKQKWVLEGGKWLVVVPKSATAMFASTDEKQPANSTSGPEELEKRRQAVSEALHFDSSSIDFGLVRQGQRVPLGLTYRLSGNEAMAWRLKAPPRGLAPSGSGDRTLVPGEGQKLELRLQTRDYDGEVNQTFSILAGRDDVEVPYEFKIHGFVYTPVSVSPRSLRFLKGESSKEVTLKNNSKSELQIVSVYSEKEGLEVQPLPQTVAPGAECRLTVTLKLKTYPTNYADNLVLRFASPVDEMESVGFSVTVNYEPVKLWQRAPWEQQPEPHP